MFLPGLLLLVLFRYVPMYGVTIAFKNFRMLDGIAASPWIGMKHFQRLFSGPDSVRVIGNTLRISLLRLLFGFPAPIILALLLNEMRNLTFKRVIQTLTYLPHFFSWVILGGIFMMIFSTTGPVNIIMKALGAKRSIEFFSNDTLFIIMIVGTYIWQTAGWSSIIYLASLAGVDRNLYEAAYIDGAGRWKQTLHISIPALIPTIITLFILNLGHIMDAGFDQIYNLYNPMVYDVSDIVDTYVLRRLQSMDYSLGTAVGLFKSAVGLVLIVATNWIANRMSGGEQGIW
jgi:putative aldouronate transport system permease protein